MKLASTLRSLVRKLSVREYKIEYSVFLLMGIYAVFFSYYSILKHYAYMTGAWDLGAYEQPLWTTVHEGKFFYGTLDLSWNPNGSFFGAHFSPILFLILPVYAIYSSTETLLVLQSIVLAGGAFPLYLLAREEFRNKAVGLAFVTMYLLYPALHGVNNFDFHVQAFLPIFLFFAFYYFKKGKMVRYFTFVVLALMCIEFVPFIVMFMGLYGFWFFRRDIIAFIKTRHKNMLKSKGLRCAFVTFLLGILWLIIALNAKSYFNPYVSPIPSTWELGTDLSSILLNIISNPQKVIQLMLRSWEDKFLYIVYLFGPVAFLSFLDPPSLLMTVPWFVASFLSSFWPYFHIDYQYSAFVIPFIFISAIYGVKRLATIQNAINFDVVKKSLALGILCCIIFAVTLSPIGVQSPWPAVTDHERLLDEIIKLIPSDASVITQNDIFAHVSRRSNAYVTIPSPATSIEYILVDVSSRWYTAPLPEPPLSTTVPKLLMEGDYHILAVADGIVLYKKGYVGRPILYVPLPYRRFKYKHLTIVNGRVNDDPTSASQKVINHSVNDPTGVFWYGPARAPAWFVPGKYKATFRLKVGSNDVSNVLRIDIAVEDGEIQSKQISGTDFKQPDQWQNFTLWFQLQKPEPSVEFRGIYVTNATDIYLDFIKVEQLSW